MTDVTGFGLASHMLEMLDAGQVAADIDLESIPLLPGATEQFAAGLESTLAPANRAAEAAISVGEVARKLPQYSALFDPQTCGGLLAGIAPSQLDEITKKLAAVGQQMFIIGTVRKCDDSATIRAR